MKLFSTFKEVKARFGYTPVRWEVKNIDPHIAFIKQMKAYISQKHVDKGGEVWFRSIMCHELGHQCRWYDAPGRFRKKLDDTMVVKKMLGDKKMVVVDRLLNYVYDLIIDTMNEDRLGNEFHAFEHQYRIMYDDFKEIREKDYTNDFAGAFLLAYPEEILGRRFTGCRFPLEVRDAAKVCVEIVRDEKVDSHTRVRKISEILIELFINKQAPKQEEQDQQSGDQQCDQNQGGEGEQQDDQQGDGQQGEGEGKPSDDQQDGSGDSSQDQQDGGQQGGSGGKPDKSDSSDKDDDEKDGQSGGDSDDEKGSGNDENEENEANGGGQGSDDESDKDESEGEGGGDSDEDSDEESKGGGGQGSDDESDKDESEGKGDGDSNDESDKDDSEGDGEGSGKGDGDGDESDKDDTEGKDGQSGSNEKDASEVEGNQDSQSGDNEEPEAPPEEYANHQHVRRNPENLSDDELQELAEQLGAPPAMTGRGDSMSVEEVKGAVESIISQLNLADDEEVSTACGIAGITTAELDFQLCLLKARREINFRVHGREPGDTDQVRVGSKPWRLSHPVRDLNVMASVQRYGQVIPEVTTVRDNYYEYPGPPRPAKFPRVWFSIDSSGSTTGSKWRKELTITSGFALIEMARRHNVPFGVNTWANSQLVWDWSKDYDNVQREFYEKIDSVGGGNSIPGCENLPGRLQEGDLLVYATDFCLYERDQSQARQILHNFIAQGVQVVFIALFDHHDAEAAKLPYVECTKLEDLTGMTIEAIKL